MKKLSLFSLLFILVAPFLEAQNYHPLVDEGKRWSTRHGFIPVGNPTSDYIEFEGDTVIGALTYQYVWRYLNEAMTQKYLEGFIREDLVQKKVFLRYTAVSEEFLLYDFNAGVGDTLILHMNPNAYVLDTIETFTLLTGEQRKSFKLHSTFPNPCSETWIEGIGSITRGVLNSGTCGFVGDDPRMLCAWENDTLKYHTPDYSYCFVITGTDDLQQMDQQVKVFPNPATNDIQVEIANGTTGPVLFEILDLSGRIILRRDMKSFKMIIPLDKNTIPPGIYLYRVASGNAIITTGKLTVL